MIVRLNIWLIIIWRNKISIWTFTLNWFLRIYTIRQIISRTFILFEMMFRTLTSSFSFIINLWFWFLNLYHLNFICEIMFRTLTTSSFSFIINLWFCFLNLYYLNVNWTFIPYIWQKSFIDNSQFGIYMGLRW